MTKPSRTLINLALLFTALALFHSRAQGARLHEPPEEEEAYDDESNQQEEASDVDGDQQEDASDADSDQQEEASGDDSHYASGQAGIDTVPSDEEEAPKPITMTRNIAQSLSLPFKAEKGDVISLSVTSLTSGFIPKIALGFPDNTWSKWVYANNPLWDSYTLRMKGRYTLMIAGSTAVKAGTVKINFLRK